MRRLAIPLPSGPLVALVALAFGLLAAVLAPSPARAAGSPNLSLAVDAADTVLLGKELAVKFTASTPPGAGSAFNLSYRAVLPSGVSYVSGSAGALAGEPTRIANQPSPGQTTLLWVNVADLAGGTSHALDFRVSHLPGIGPQGNFTLRGDAHAQNDRRYVPPFTPTGTADAAASHPATASAENVTRNVKLAAISVTKDTENTPDDELLRGVHDQQTVHTLTIRTNTQAPMTQTFVNDYLPAGIEFLGCGSATVKVDNTTNAPTNPGSAREYPGAPEITVPATSGCITPISVQSSTFDPDGAATAFSSGIYTLVRWSLGTLTPNTELTIRYRAAIPLRRNTATWTTATPSVSGAQTANLNNNSGTEVADEEPLVGYASAVGFYNGMAAQSLSADTTMRRFAEDLAVVKRARTSGLAQGTTVLWDLDVRTSEYRDGSDVVVTDTVPDGLCPLRSGGPLTAGTPSTADTAECSSSGPSPTVPYSSATEQPGGTFTVVWNQSTDPALARLAPSSTHRITFPTATRSHYQEAFEDAGSVLAGDVVTGAVGVAGSARVVCAGRVACPSGAPTGTEIAHDGPLSTGAADVSTDKLSAGVPTLDQKIATTSSDCASATYSDGAPIPAYRPGDRICWLLRVDYPSLVTSQGDTLVDYLPSSVAFDAAFGSQGEQPTSADTAGAGAVDASTATPGPGGELRWSIPGAVSSGGVFERRIATRARLPAGAAVGDVSTNLFKSSSLTTGGAANVPLRDTAPYKLSMPVMSIQKRVVALGGTDLPAPVATQVVRGGDVVKMQVTLTNASDDTAAERAEVWDRLPAGVTCADVTASGGSISPGGICDSADDTVKWGSGAMIGPDVSASGTANLTYLVRVPTTTRPTQTLTSSAGIRQYRTTTNTGGVFTYVPASNVDPTQSSVANVVSAGSSATLTGAEPTITETRTTSVTETKSGIEYNGNADATIGETIHYTVNTTIPAGITVENFRVTDTVDARHTFLPATLTLTSGTVPSGGSFGPSGSDILLDLGPSWTAPTGTDSTFTFEFDAIVADSVDTFRTGFPMSNQAKLGYDNWAGSPARNETLGIAATTTVVEPVVTADKTVDVGTTPVIGGQIVEYTVKVGAAVGAASPAHETTLFDDVPVGLTPVDGSGTPVADGAPVPDGDPALVDGVWNQTTRRITFAPEATIYPGATNTFKYRASVDIPPVSGTSLTNKVTARTTSLAGTPALPSVERSMASARTAGYEAVKTVTLTARTPSVTTSASPATLTPGEQATYTVVATIPANTIAYDVFVRDALPPEMEFDGHVSQVCTAGCVSGATTPTIQQYTPFTSGGNVQVVAWDLADLTTSSPQPRTIELRYKAHLRLTRRTVATTIIRPATAQSTTTVASNRTDRVTGAFDAANVPAPPGGFNDTSAPANATVTTVEPVMAIDKQLAVNAGGYGSTAATVHDGDLLHYRVTVRNTGDSPAYDVQVRDVPPAKFRNVRMGAGSATTTNFDPWVVPGDDVGWLIPGPIPPNGSVVLDYDADLPVVTDMKDNDAFVNTATIQHAWGVSSLSRAERPSPQWGYRDYNVTSIPSLTRSTTAIYDGPTISVSKTTGISPGFPKNGPAEVNKAFTWRVTVINTSGTAAGKNITVRDTLPRDWRYVPNTSAFTAGTTVEPVVTSQPTGDQLVWSTTTPLAAGASILLTYQARPTIASATSIGTGLAVSARHVNSATASVLNSLDAPADGGGPFAPAAPDTAYATLSVPIISVAKTPDAPALPAAATGAQFAAGTTVDYMIKVRNTGTAVASNVIVTDTLPADAIPNTFTPGSATALPSSGFSQVSADDDKVVFKIASLPINGTVDIKVPVRTDPAAAESSDLVNGASVASDQTDPVVDNGTIRLVGNADLRATKSASTAATPVGAVAVTAGQSLSYTLGATNLGPSVARDVVLTDNLPATVNVVDTPADPLPSGCVYTPRPTHRVVCTFPGVTAVGSAVSAVIKTRVRTGISTNANNTVTATLATADVVPANNAATVNVDVGEIADLSLVAGLRADVAGDPPTKTKRVMRGDQVSMDLTFKNLGPSDALNASVSATLPAGLTYVSDTGSCTFAAPTRTLTCPVTGGVMAYEPSTPALPTDPGAPRTITVVATATGLGVQTSSASVSGGATAEPTPLDNTDTTTVTIDPSVDLGLTLTAPPSIGAGEVLTYALVATNAGRDTSTGTVITQTLPAGTTFESADPGCTFAAPDQLTCAIGDLAGVGQVGRAGTPGSVTRHVAVRVPFAMADRAITSNASVASVETAIDPSDVVEPAAASASTQVGPAADLSITQEAPTDVAAGGSITYTLVVRNEGPSTAPGVIVTDTLPAGAVFRAASSSTGTCSEAGGTVTCALGALGFGTSTVLTITVDLPAGLAGGTITNAASVRSSIVDPTPANASSSLARPLAASPPPPPAPTPTPAPSPTPAPAPEPPIVPGKANLLLTKKAEGVARAGRELTYTITAFNRGPAAASDTVVTDALVGGVEYKNARAGAGTCGFDEGTVKCRIGSLAAGESINMRVIVVPSRTGQLVNDAVVSSKTDDPDMADNRAVATNTVSPRPPTKLKVQSSASSVKLRGGQRVTFTLKVRNTGPNEAVGVEVCDKLPVGMSFTSTKGGVLKGSRLCLTRASLMPGKTATFKVKVRLSARARRGKIVNVMSADAENASLQNAATAARVLSDGKVGSGVVRGFTG